MSLPFLALLLRTYADIRAPSAGEVPKLAPAEDERLVPLVAPAEFCDLPYREAVTKGYRLDEIPALE